ncbi:YceI family protein [Mucilaginibacter sp. UR6-11]|uniref:YceI family protein n=1 Tax=Mucilaginibacter sp. UR6-11 TaxID=1435644 RepID=UPI001E29F435|nr:YceI family protein [Mucilaginibacter sp. UR6-11]MCC8425060.1 YceI family protein [Mucilaginibacter sp. UR6-11]
MKRITTLLLLLFAAAVSHAQLKPVEQASTLKFTIKNLGFDVDGSFTGFEGNISFDPQSLAASSFDVTIKTATINTDNNLRDEHLKGSSFFDARNYPNIRLTVSKVMPTNKIGLYMLNGQLTIKGKTQAIQFPFSATAIARGYQFKGSFKMKRKDFGVGGTSTVADELEVVLDVTATKSQASS